MSPELVGILGVVMLMVLLAAGVWIGAATAIVSTLGIVYILGFKKAFILIGSVPYDSVVNYAMSVMPMFILMGLVISETDIGADLYRSARRWIGQIRGGMASATVVANAVLGAITGTSMAGLVVMGKIAIPEMKKYGYDDGLANGSIAAGGTISTLIPPSLPLIMYGVLTEQSIGKLFMAGVIPGLLEAFLYIGVITILCWIRPKMGPPGPRTTFKEKIYSLKSTWAVMVLFLIVMGGIYGGLFTPTEAGAIGAFGAIAIALISRRATTKKLIDSFIETAVMTAVIMVMIIGVFMFSNFMAISRLPNFLTELLVAAELSQWVFMLAISILFIILGCFLPGASMVMITIPVLFPVVQSMGINAIWFGIIMVKMMEIGSITPPMGMNVFILSSVTKTPIATVYRGIVPFFVADLVHLALLLAFPALSLFLPSMMS